MKKLIEKRIKETWQRDLMAELSIELYKEGYRQSDIQFGNDPAKLMIANYLRDLEINGFTIPNRFGAKKYFIDKP